MENKVRIGLIQVKQNKIYDFEKIDRIDIPKKRKLVSDYIKRNIELVKEAAQRGCNVIVTTEAINFCRPECSDKAQYEDMIPRLPYDEKNLEDISDEKEYLFEELETISCLYGCYIFAGIINKRQEWYNSVIVYGPDGRPILLYDKIQLAGDEKLLYKPGKEVKYIDTKYGRIGTLICYDMQFPELPRALARRQVDLIVTPTWGWEWIYGPARAYENGVCVAAAMSVPYRLDIEGLRSPSQVIMPDGSIVAEGSRQYEEIVIADVDITTSRNYRNSRVEEIHKNFI